MYKNSLSLFGAIALAVVSSHVFSATISLDPGSLTVTPNQSFNIDLRLDIDPLAEFGVDPVDAAYSGDVVIQYDGNDLVLDGFALDAAQSGAGSFSELSNTSGTYALRFNGIAFSATSGGVIGSLSFTGKGFSGDSSLMIGDNNPGNSLVILAGGSLQNLLPIFTGTTVSAVPVPAAAWLMLSGMGLLGFSTRRK